MTKIVVSDLIRYPLKSCTGTQLSRTSITPKGLTYDRHWALFDKGLQGITGRTHPQLLDIEIRIEDSSISVIHGSSQLSLNEGITGKSPIEAKVFSYDLEGYHVNKELDEWFSDYIGMQCSLMVNDSILNRPVLAKHGGLSGEVLGFADQAPILLLSEESLSDLNSKLDDPIPYNRFRPNIVVKGTTPYAEDTWKQVAIGDCTFRVIQKCERCIFTTIDPDTKTKHPKQEPLRTLATYRKNDSNGVDFGVHLVPIKIGSIKTGDIVSVE